METATSCVPSSQTTRSLFSAASLVDEHLSLGTFDWLTEWKLVKLVAGNIARRHSNWMICMPFKTNRVYPLEYMLCKEFLRFPISSNLCRATQTNLNNWWTYALSPFLVGSLQYFTPNNDIWTLLDPRKVTPPNFKSKCLKQTKLHK